MHARALGTYTRLTVLVSGVYGVCVCVFALAFSPARERNPEDEGENRMLLYSTATLLSTTSVD